MQTFQQRLASLRESSGLGKTETAKRLGISLRAYQYYEDGGREPTLSVLLRFAEFYSVSLDYLCGLSDDPHGH